VLDRLSRRQFFKVAAGAGAALLLPERKVWALDRTMIPPQNSSMMDVNYAPGRIFINGIEVPVAGPFDEELRREMARRKLALENAIVYEGGGHPASGWTLVTEYDVATGAVDIEELRGKDIIPGNGAYIYVHGIDRL
jgi:hypothetical protein